jgi:hypothetical protein
MPTFTVHQPPPRKGDTTNESVSAPERFVFVRDGFYFWAFLLAPLWLLVHRLWLVLLGYVVVTIALGAVLVLTGAPAPVRYIAAFLIALLVGLEAASLWRWTLARRKWQTLGFVVGEDTEMAERRFYAEWAKKHAERTGVPVSAEPEPAYSAPLWRGAPAPSDVIGLFPEPGGQR